jgi:hypothetical protein
MNTSDEEYRHQCEVRSFLRMKASGQMTRALALIGRVLVTRGQEAADRIRRDANEQWEKGNRGEDGCWC